MLKLTAEEVLERIEQHWQNLLFVRSLSPYLSDNLVGTTAIRTGTYYIHRGYEATLRFDEPLTQERIRQLDLATHWVNQGFVIRLYAFLNYCGVCGDGVKINQKLNGWGELDILRRLRNYFAHTSGFYDPNDDEMRKTYECMTSHFHLDQGVQTEGESLFPIAIDSVLAPLVEGCKEYVSMLYRLESPKSTCESRQSYHPIR